MPIGAEVVSKYSRKAATPTNMHVRHSKNGARKQASNSFERGKYVPAMQVNLDGTWRLTSNHRSPFS